MRARSPMLLLLVAAATGCADDFVPFNRLERLRVLAVRAEPAAPAPGETAALDALTYLPPGQAVAGRAWSWCPLPGSSGEGSPCLVSEEEATELAAAAGSELPPFDLGSGETASFEHTLDPDLLAALCAGFADQPSLVDCTGGFPIQIKLVVTSDEGEELTTLSQLRLRFDDAHQPNANPVIERLVVVIGDDEVELGPAPDAAVPREEEAELRVAIPIASAESFTGSDDAGEPEERVERLLLTWFVESGDTENEHTTYIEGVEGLEEAMSNTWEPADADDYPRDDSQVVVVLRDERGGVSWRSGVASLSEAAP